MLRLILLGLFIGSNLYATTPAKSPPPAQRGFFQRISDSLSGSSGKAPKVQKDEIVATNRCPTSLVPGTIQCHIFPEGCLKVPSNWNGQALVYFRGYIQNGQRPPQSTESLFNNGDKYHLERVATKRNEAILATHSYGTKLSEKTLACLKSLTGKSKIDVASHSGGYEGFQNSAGVLAGNTDHLFLLDNFYDPDNLKKAIKRIGARTCTGFYTDYITKKNNSIVAYARAVQKATNCNLKLVQGHTGEVAPFLVKSENPNINYSEDPKFVESGPSAEELSHSPKI